MAAVVGVRIERNDVATTNLTVAMGSVMRHITVTIRVTGVRRFAVRQWIAVRLLKLAAVILGCNIDVLFPDQMPPT